MNTRSSDNGVDTERLRQARSEGRRRTLVMSILASGFVALFIGHAFETAGFNQQATRSRTNCVLSQRGLAVTIARFERSADGVLGDPERGIKPFDFTDSPFERYKPLILAQARSDRHDAEEYKSLRVNCKQIFPKRSYIPFA